MSSVPQHKQSPVVWPRILCIAVTAIAGAVLILLVPRLFAGAGPAMWGVAAGLAILVIGFGTLGIRLRGRP